MLVDIILNLFLFLILNQQPIASFILFIYKIMPYLLFYMHFKEGCKQAFICLVNV